MKARTKRALVAGALAGAVLEHELTGHGDPHVELDELREPYLVVREVVVTSTGIEEAPWCLGGGGR